MFNHNILANTLIANGMTKEQATVEMNQLFAVHGHFPKTRELQIRLDALKEIAIWR